MKKFLSFTAVLIAVFSFSCGVKEENSPNGSENIFSGSLSGNGDYFNQDPLPSGTDQTDPSPESEPTQEQGDSSKPFPVKPNGDFTYTDQNGVTITKKDGTQTTEFSETEEYVLPDMI